MACMTFSMSNAVSTVPSTLDLARIDAEQAAVRGQIVSRLESLYQLCEGNREIPGPEGARWAELSVRCLDRIAKHYRLDDERPGDEVEPASADEAARGSLRGIVSAQLDALSERG
jgi:hypothetical protein